MTADPSGDARALRMSDSIRCVFLTPTDDLRRRLRRYTTPGVERSCPKNPVWGCDAAAVLDTVHRPGATERAGDWPDEFPHDDSRWPTACAACGRRFADADAWQLVEDRLYARSDGGDPVTLADAPPGAMWDAVWLHDVFPKGPDGRVLTVKLPTGHQWLVEGRASNCTKPGDTAHRCWVRHGDVPNVTVDKNGLTCDAGAGSIAVSGWHGFLRDGFLVAC